MENIGYLLRNKHGEGNVFIVGFGTHRGSVLTGRRWGAPTETMLIPVAMENSYGDIFFQAGIPKALLIFNEESRIYVPTILPKKQCIYFFRKNRPVEAIVADFYHKSINV